MFASPRPLVVSPRAGEAEKDVGAHIVRVTAIPEESPPKSEESRSSDSISYYLKLRKDPPEQQQQQQQQDTQPQRRTLKHTDSVQLTKARLQHEAQPPHTSQQQLQLRQVSQRGNN